MPALTLLAAFALSLIAYAVTAALIPRLAPTLVGAGLKGRDMLKGPNRGGGGPGAIQRRTAAPSMNGGAGPPPVPASDSMRTGEELPESTGLVAGGIYVLVLSLFAPLPFYSHLLPTPSSLWPLPGQTAFALPEGQAAGDEGIAFPHASLSTHLASLLSLLTAVFLGFLDDVFDIRWRFKLPIPVIASVPLLTAYAASQGGTDIVVPRVFGLRELLGVAHNGGLLRLGALYYIYMSMLSTFCTNSINILAGINGVEVAQSLVIALSIILNDILYIRIDVANLPFVAEGNEPRYIGFGLARGSRELEDRHLFSLYFMMPLVAVMLALLKYNWYPARAFVGDTFCYFAGMAFAVVGILGHFSKTLLLFFIPQVFNFLYSCPQLFGLVPNPRHRLPARDPRTDLLHPSTVLFVSAPPAKTTATLKIMEKLGLVKLERTRGGGIVSSTNLTLLNLILVRRGPMREDRLTLWVVGLQIAGSAAAFGVRYGLASVFYEASRR